MNTEYPAVLEELTRLHQGIEAQLGHDPSAVRADAAPLRDLPGFDSPLIPTIIRRLLRILGWPVPKRLKNPYLGAAGERNLRLAQVAERFCSLYHERSRNAG